LLPCCLTGSYSSPDASAQKSKQDIDSSEEMLKSFSAYLSAEPTLDKRKETRTPLNRKTAASICTSDIGSEADD